MKGAIRLVMLVVPLVGMAACNGVQARTPVLDPALVTPAPPPRVIVPATVTIPDPDPPAQVLPPVRTSPPANRQPDRPAPAVTPPATPPETSTTTAPPPVLQATSNVEGLEAKTRAAIGKANGDLGRVNPATLGADARAQYDTAKSFIRQADEALKGKNLIYAKELADKAVALAGLLVR